MTRVRTRATEREPMRRMPRGLTLCVLFLGAALLSCDGPNRGPSTQPSAVSGFSIAVTASPNVVRGATPGSDVEDGGCATIQAVVSKNGVLVDGALVSVTTTLGVFKSDTEDLVGFLDSPTTRGVATFGWCAKDTRGTSTITATVEDAHTSVLITIF
jgi:hypothetical protein